MSIQAVAWVLDQHPDNLPGKAKLVLVSIANHADHTNGFCWLSLETISHESSMPVRSLYRYIGALVRNGYLRKQLRKGEDGKQRATDYWIMFDRAPHAWDWGAKGDTDEDAEAQDVVEPSATVADGEITADEMESAAVADGPSAIGGSRYIAEPSESNPSYEEEAPAFDPSAPPRRYRPPPVEPMGAIVDPKGKQIFVILGTRAWDAWCKRKKAERGSEWNLTTTATVNGKVRRGWYFPSLFPPGHDPPQGELSPEDSEAICNF